MVKSDNIFVPQGASVEMIPAGSPDYHSRLQGFFYTPIPYRGVGERALTNPPLSIIFIYHQSMLTIDKVLNRCLNWFVKVMYSIMFIYTSYKIYYETKFWLEVTAPKYLNSNELHSFALMGRRDCHCGKR